MSTAMRSTYASSARCAVPDAQTTTVGEVVHLVDAVAGSAATRTPVGTRSAFFGRGTMAKRRVWQAEATAPPRERQGEPGRASHFGQACCSTSSASVRSLGEGC
ncbi:hypothetical protein ACFU7U_09485 [Streptomyces celluloflavus]|uniref:hypothetical protein n=1 Tax=Streptomyces celluloflavus TaxID=58344 RepID=UPI0036C3AA26